MKKSPFGPEGDEPQTQSIHEEPDYSAAPAPMEPAAPLPPVAPSVRIPAFAPISTAANPSGRYRPKPTGRVHLSPEEELRFRRWRRRVWICFFLGTTIMSIVVVWVNLALR